MKLLVTLAVVALVSLALVEARPHQHRGKSHSGGFRTHAQNIGSRIGGGMRPSRRSHGPRGVIACLRTEIDNGVEVVKENETESCPDEYPCTVKGQQVTVNSKVNEISFCNTPFPSPKMACKIENADGTTRDGHKTCTDEEQCTAKYQGTGRDGSAITYYICVPKGTTTNPTKPNYAQILLRRACSIDGETKHNCSRDGACEGIKITVDGKQAQFCHKNDSSEEMEDESEILSLFESGCDKKKDPASKADDDSSADSSASDDSSDESSNAADSESSEEAGAAPAAGGNSIP